MRCTTNQSRYGISQVIFHEIRGRGNHHQVKMASESMAAVKAKALRVLKYSVFFFHDKNILLRPDNPEGKTATKIFLFWEQENKNNSLYISCFITSENLSKNFFIMIAKDFLYYDLFNTVFIQFIFENKILLFLKYYLLFWFLLAEKKHVLSNSIELNELNVLISTILPPATNFYWLINNSDGLKMGISKKVILRNNGRPASPSCYIFSINIKIKKVRKYQRLVITRLVHFE